MKTGAVIPTRGDRPQFLRNALRQMDAQTRRLDVVEVVQDAPVDMRKDITRRYRLGCERLIEKGCDLVFFIEDDDYYRADYVETMLGEWEAAGRPAIFGIGETIYYHLRAKKWHRQKHPGRSSAFCTVVTAGALKDYRWPVDSEPFLDIHIWRSIGGKTVQLGARPMCVGIKGHMEGRLFGGIGHDSSRMRYTTDDADGGWFRENVDADSLSFYKKYMR